MTRYRWGGALSVLPRRRLVERLYYLKTALAALLVFIGVKMALGQVVGKIGPEISLPIIVAILGIGVIASLVRDRRTDAGGNACDDVVDMHAAQGPAQDRHA